jgi:hypothetical protein
MLKDQKAVRPKAKKAERLKVKGKIEFSRLRQKSLNKMLPLSLSLSFDVFHFQLTSTRERRQPPVDKVIKLCSSSIMLP